MVTPKPTKPNQESVWAYPRPAIAQTCDHHLKIVHGGLVVAETRCGVRTLETSHPPSYYFPRAAIAMNLLRPSASRSACEWKGQAVYFDVTIGGETLHDVGWSYPAPSPTFQMLQNYVAFYATPFEGCFVDGEKAVPQPGTFYGGWVTSHVAGPFKGVPGSMSW